MLESEFLNEYETRLTEFVNSCVVKIQSNSHLSFSDLYYKSTELYSDIVNEAYNLIFSIMKENNIDLNSQIRQTLSVYVPIVSYLHLATFSIQSKLLNFYNNEIGPILEQADQKD